MQAEQPKLYLLHNKIFTAYKIILDCFIKPVYLELTVEERYTTANEDLVLETKILDIEFENVELQLPLKDIYLGGNIVGITVVKDLPLDYLMQFRQKCLAFYVECLKQMRHRYPVEQKEQIRNLKFLDPLVLIHPDEKRKVPSIAHLRRLFPDSITAAGPVFVAPVGNQTAAIGREVVFSCSVRNIGKYRVGWLRASDQTILSVHARTVTHNARIAVSYETGGSSGSGAVSGNAFGVTGSSQATEEVVNGTWRLHIRQLKESDRDCYMCQINTSPMISELGCLDILVPPDIVYGGDTSADLAVSEGDNATLSCCAIGRPTPRVSWRREDGEPILIRASSAGGSTFERHETYNGSLLQFHRVERRQMGAYLCIASNDVPPAVSKRVTLAVNFAPVVKAPNQLLGAPLGTDVQLECYVEAFPNTINYWVKNRLGSEDEMLLEGLKYRVREERSGYKVLMWLLIKGFTVQDVGSYKCVSTNSLGKADGTLRLYEIKITIDRSSRGKDHVSIIGGLAEAAQSSGANNGSKGFLERSNKLSHFLSMFLFIPVFLWPR